MIEAVGAKAEAMEAAEVTAWRDNFLRVALGSDSSSFISQLLSSQQVPSHPLSSLASLASLASRLSPPLSSPLTRCSLPNAWPSCRLR